MEKKQVKKEQPVYFDEISTKGRKKLILNEAGASAVEKLAGIMCTDEEIASVLGVCVDTLTNNNNIKTFSECKKRGQESGKASLRRMQFDTAKRGNATMQIFLGKNYLGQTDKTEMEQTFDKEININITPASPLNESDDEE